MTARQYACQNPRISATKSRLRSGTRTVHLAEILASTEEAVGPHQATRPAVDA